MATNKELKEFVDHGIEIAEKLLNENKYVDALKASKEILEVDPNNRRAKKILEKSLESIEKEKQEIFKRNFPAMKDLYKKGDYIAALEIGVKLKRIATNAKLIRLISKCEKRIREKELEDARSYLKNGFDKHKAFEKQKEWIKSIEVLNEMLSVAPKNEEIKAMLKKDKIRYINDQLRSNIKKDLLKEKKYEELYKFYQKLYFVFPEYTKLKKEIFALEKVMTKEDRETKSAYLEENLAKIKNMLASKQFEEAVKASEETVIITKFSNKKAIGAYKKAIEANDEDTDAKLGSIMGKIVTDLKNEFSANPQDFIRI